MSIFQRLSIFVAGRRPRHGATGVEVGLRKEIEGIPTAAKRM